MCNQRKGSKYYFDTTRARPTYTDLPWASAVPFPISLPPRISLHPPAHGAPEVERPMGSMNGYVPVDAKLKFVRILDSDAVEAF